MKVAAVCMNAEPGQISKNLEKIYHFASLAAEGKAEFVCFPELSVSGYVLEKPNEIYSREESENIINKIIKIAEDCKIVILAGFIEIREGNLPFISHVVATPEGVKGIYRKTHLSPPEESKYREGQSIDVFEYKGMCFGIQLCYEAHFPEISTIMVLKGAKVIFVPHASPRGTPDDKTKSWTRHLPARAFDNAVYVVACNQTGKTGTGLSFPGGALFFGPDGHLLAKHNKPGEAVIFAELDMGYLKAVRNHPMKYFLPRRRPELYGSIAEQNKNFT